MNIPYISNPTANTKTANSNVTLEVIGPSAAEASQSFTVGTHDSVAFAVENITEVQSKTDLRAKYTDKGGYALAAASETIGHALVQNFSQSEGTLGVEPTEDNWMGAMQALDDANAPRGDRFIAVRPATFYAMQKIDRFVNADYVGPNAAQASVKANVIDIVFDAPVFMTTLVRAPAGGQAENWCCHRDGVYYCSQDLRSNPPSWDHDRDAWVTTLTHIFGWEEALQPPITAGGGAATDVFNVNVRGTS